MALLRKIIRIVVSALVVLLVFAGAAIAVLTLTDKGRENLAGLVSTLISSPDQTVRISGIEGIWANPTTIGQVMVEDRSGPWLALRGVEIDWSRSALLGMSFVADRVSAQRIEVARQPEPSATPPEPDAEPFSLPVSLDIKAIDLPDIALGAGLAGGTVASVAAKGSLQAEADPLEVQSTLSVTRSDGTPGDLDATIEFVPAGNILNIDLRASEPSGGIIASLLSLPGAPAVDINVSGEGSASDWRGTGTFAVDGTVVTTVTGRHQFTDSGSVVEASGDGEFARFLPRKFQVLVAGKSTFEIAGMVLSADGVAVQRATIESTALSASATGTLDPRGASDFSLVVDAKDGGVALSLGTEASPIDLTVASAALRVLGDGGAPAVDITAVLPSLAIDATRLAGLDLKVRSDSFDLSTRSGPFDATASAQSLTIGNPTIDPLTAGVVRLGLAGEVAGQAITARSGTLTSDAIDGSFTGTVSTADGTFTFDLNADVVAAALPAAAAPFLGERVALTTSLARDTQGNVSANALSLRSGGLAADGTVRILPSGIDAALTGTFADVAPLAPQANGAIAFAARATGPLVTPEVSVTVTSDSMTVAEREITGLELTATSTLDAASPVANVALKGTVGGEALSGSAVLATVDGRPEVDGLSLVLGQNTISGDLTFDEAFLPTGTVDFTLPDIGPLAALALQTLEGDLAGRVTFTSDGAAPQARIAAQSNTISRGDVSATGVAIDAVIADFMATPSISGTVRAAEARSGSTVLADIAADITAEASGSDWSGTARLALGGDDVSSVTARYRPTDGGSVIEATGDGAFARFLPPRLQPLLEGSTRFDVSGTITPSGGTEIERASIETDALSATASGSVNPAGASDVSLTVSARNGSVPLSLGTEESPIDIAFASATLRMLGESGAPALDITALLPSVATNVTELTNLELKIHSDAFDLATRTGPFDGTAEADSLTLDNPTIAPLVSGVLRAGLRGRLAEDNVTIDAGSLVSDALDGNFTGTVSLMDGAITLDLNADVLGAALPAAAAPFLGERVALSTSLVRDTEGNVSANALSVRSGGLTADGSVKILPTGLDADLTGTFADLSAVAPQAQGAIAFAARATGPLAAPQVAATVTSEGISVADRQISGLELTASATLDAANPTANVALKGMVGQEALSGSAVLTTTDGRREVRGLSLVLGQNRISGDLSLDEAFVPTGTIDVALPDIGPLAALALETVEGDLAGTITFTRDGTVPQARVTARSDSIVRGDVSAKSIAIDATVDDFMASPVATGTVRAAEARSGATVLTGVDVTLSQDGSWTEFSAATSLDGNPVRAVGRVGVEGGVTTVELASGAATFRGIEASIARPSTVTVSGGQASLDNVALSVGGGTVALAGTAGTTLNLTATLSQVPASLANGFAPGIGASGTISGTVRATGTAANPTVNYTVDWSGARTSQTGAAGFGALSIRSSGTFADGTLNFDASVGDGSGLTLNGGGTVGTKGTPQLALNFDGTVPLAFLTQRLASQGLSLTGNAAVSLRVSGPATAPAIEGSIRANGLRFVDSRSGIAVNDIAADIALGSGRATITRLNGTLSTGGTLTATGTVGINAGQGFPADLSITIADGRYTDGQVVTTTLSGALSVTGPLVSAPRLAGTVTLGRTVITVPERLPSSLAQLDVKHRNAPAPVRAQDQALNPATTGGSSGGLTLDITVDAPQQIFVQGRGLDAELGGSLRLTGPVSSPQATGQFTMRRGRLSILGRRLTFTRGTLGFSGSLVPYLDLAADSVAGDVTVTVLVTGPANNPQFTFQSIPSLPEDEVMARLVFGRSMSNLSPIQIAQLAEAAAHFAGIGGSTSLLNTLRGQLGVDDLDIKTDEQGGTSVSAGKYLNDRTYVTIEKGDRAGSGKAAIDLDIGRGVKLRGEATDAGEAKGGIFFEREY